MSEVRSPASGGVFPPGTGMPFAMLGVMWGAAGLVGIVWLVGSGLAVLAGGSWADRPAYNFDLAVTLVTDGPGSVWPTISTTVLWVAVGIASGLLALLVGVPLARRAARRGRAGDPARSLATVHDLDQLHGRTAAARAQRLRPSLSSAKPKELVPSQVGMTLGLHRPSGTRLVASWEDVALAVMAPRAGKTTALAVPAVLDAPGAVVATSNKGDLWAATASIRAARGTVWTFDPQGIIGVEQTWWWNPLAAVTDVESAQRLAGHFVQMVRGGGQRSQAGSGQDFWSSAAEDLLTSLLLAAAVAGEPITEVYGWLSESTSPIPASLLRQHGHDVVADALQSRQHGAPDTREGIFETARTAAQSLRDPQIAAWVTKPDRPLPQLDVDKLPASTDSLFLHSKDGAGAAAPLVAALVDQIMRAATVAAERRGGRLDPPLVAVLDEAANICRIGDLPELYSHFGSRGILPLTILQSYRQGARVWGDAGMDALWSAATIKLIGAGIDDPKLAEDLSRLAGERDVTVRSNSYGRDHSTSLSLRKERILSPEKIRALPRGTALLLATGVPVALLDLLPWYRGPHADKVTASIDAAQAAATALAATPTPPVTSHP